LGERIACRPGNSVIKTSRTYQAAPEKGFATLTLSGTFPKNFAERTSGESEVVEQVQNYGDVRQTAFCAYCGGPTETRDHVPSKVLLDEPYPTNLPVVPACQKCNQGFSQDEEYFACLLGCVLAGSADAYCIERKKIRKILERKPALASRLSQACQEVNGRPFFNVETERVMNVALKLARGHAAFELNEPQLDNPSNLDILPFTFMTSGVRRDFEAPPDSSIWPEVGSRAMQRLVVNEPGTSSWIIVQPGKYRYLTSVGNGVVVRIVFSEYLACQVAWG